MHVTEGVSFIHTRLWGRENLAHLSVEDPIEVFVALVGSSGAALNGTEKLGMPVNTLVGALGGFISLTIFDLGLFVGCGLVVLGQDRLDSVLP